MRRRGGAALLVAVLVGLAGACSSGGESQSQHLPPRTSPSRSAIESGSAVALPSRSGSSAPTSRPALPAVAYVDVAVASVWRTPQSTRSVDQPALAAPVDLRGWLATMSLQQRRDLVGRVDTQALLGDPLAVDELRSGWAHVTVTGQESPLDAHGYPGWVPAAQLTFHAPVPEPTVATVVTTTAWLSDPVTGDKTVETSPGTRLPVRERSADTVTVLTPDGVALRYPAVDVVVGAPTSTPLPSSAAAAVATARSLTGVPYLWGGTSGFGLDCSGLTSLSYRVHGVRIPRDADAQAAAGTPVPSGGVVPGDVLFYAPASTVEHDAMAVGSGLVVQAPETGRTVEIVTQTQASAAGTFVGARRFVP